MIRNVHTCYIHFVLDSVSYTIVEQSDCVIRVTFDNVPLGRLSHVKGMLMETLESIDVDTFDQSRMKVVIQRRIAEHLAAEERYPHDLLAGMAIGDTLYGRDEKDVSMMSMSRYVDVSNRVRCSLQRGWIR